MRQQRWREAVTELLAAAELSHGDLAAQVGLPRPNITRWLSGAVKKPTAGSIRDVNRAMTRLLKDPQVEHYLLAIALWEGRKPQRPKCKRARLASRNSALRECCVSSTRLLRRRPARRSTGLHETSKTPKDEGRRFSFSVCQCARGKLLLGRLQGRVPERPLAEELLSLLKAIGLNVKPWLRSDAELEGRRARDRFQLARPASAPKARGRHCAPFTSGNYRWHS